MKPMDVIDRHAEASVNFRHIGRFQQYGAALSRLVLLADAVAIYVTLYLCVRIQLGSWTQRFVTLALLAIVILSVAVSWRQVFRTWRLARLRVELVEITVLHTLSMLIVLSVLLLATDWAWEASNLVLFCTWFTVSLASMAAIRFLLRQLLATYRVGPEHHRKVAFLGTSQSARNLATLFKAQPWMGIDVIGSYSLESSGPGSCPVSGALVDGGLKDLLDLAERGHVGAVYIAPVSPSELRLKELVDAFADTMTSIYYCPPLLELGLLSANWDDVFGHPVVGIVASPFDGWGRHIKRFEDLALAVVILLAVAPVMALVGVAVKLSSPGPVIYRQHRHGMGGKPFCIMKFRTMYTIDADHEFVQARQGDSRITRLGAVLRRTSLDELPQFFNVLIGDMSVVGPRPAPLKYNEDHRRVIHRYMLRHKVKPGITGLAQVSGSRGETATVGKTEERTAFDLYYINNWSFWLDLRILAKTLVLTLRELVRK